MKIALVAPTGKIGSEIAKEALRQGHEVIGIVRSDRAAPEGLESVNFKAVDIADTAAFADAIKGADVLASAYGPQHDNIDTVAAAAEAIVAAARAAGIKRVVVIGGAGSLEVAPGLQLVDVPDFPEAYKAYALAHRKAFNVFKTVDDLDWTFFSPAAEIGPGDKVGNYKVVAKTFLANADGHSKISYPDYAEAFVAEIEQGKFLKDIITVAYQ
ncbi:NAD(P)-dependent oxidoreductase [Leeia oryzae]|uniref:NAD(P)-dependent oxidoreductase n=1 Tax=Leeia oryzae TaxID=356662 RepID=UPI0003654C6C|nr:NAD(P)H-binding protein [Leeia oryzae]